MRRRRASRFRLARLSYPSLRGKPHAPAASAGTAAATGRQVEVPYTGDYTFWKAKGSH
jgi:hypothetical protein